METSERVEFQILPGMCALAEVACRQRPGARHPAVSAGRIRVGRCGAFVGYRARLFCIALSAGAAHSPQRRRLREG